MTKVTNIPSRLHSVEQGNIVAGANEIYDDTKGKKQNVINSETDAELLRLEQSKQDNLTFDNAPTENSNNPVKSGGVYAADLALQQAIEAILLLIPSAATSLNQLADKAFVNSSISTATATFRGTYNVVTDLHLAVDATHAQIEAALASVVATADNNDYCYVQIPVSSSSQDIQKTSRYKFNGTAWVFEYDLNTSGFTAAQWASINSGITAALVTKLGDLPYASELSEDLQGLSTAIQGILGLIPSAATSSNKLTDKAYVDGLIQAITELIPEEATDQNQLADKAYVLAQILAATPAFKGQFTTFAALEAVSSPKAGDIGIVRTTDNDGFAVFTFYQYLNNQWNVYYTLANHLQNKPATTGTTGDYPYNGMGRVVLPMNIKEIGGVAANYLEQSMMPTATGGNTIYVITHDYIISSNLTIPANCVLEFEGGSIDGAYTITCQNTLIKGNPIFKSATLGGTIKESFNVSWLNIPDSYNANTLPRLMSLCNACDDVVWDVNDIYIMGSTDDVYIPIHVGVNDYRNCTFHLKNTTAAEIHHLFKYEGELLDFPTTPQSVADCVASPVFTDAAGCIVLNDETRMTNRGGSYDVFRRDIIYVQNNVAFNKPILPYDGDTQTNMRAKYFVVDYNGIIVKNINVIREPDNTAVYDVIDIKNAYNVSVENVYIYTEESTTLLSYDKANSFYTIYNLSLKDLTIDGGYSADSVYAYGWVFDNVANVKIDNIQAYNRWSASAGNCVNNAYITNSAFQRFDTHYYSKDFHFVNCTFFGNGMSVAGHFGYLRADSCIFYSSYAVYNDGSYGTHTEYDIILNNCTFDGITGFVKWGGNDTEYRNIVQYKRYPSLYVNCAKIINSNIKIFDNIASGMKNVPKVSLVGVTICDGISTIDVANSYLVVELYIRDYQDYNLPTEYADGGNSLFVSSKLINSHIKIENSILNIYGLRWLIGTSGYNVFVEVDSCILYGGFGQGQHISNSDKCVFRNCECNLVAYNNRAVVLQYGMYENCTMNVLGSMQLSLTYNFSIFKYCELNNATFTLSEDTIYQFNGYSLFIVSIKGKLLAGATSERPSGVNAGFRYFDTTLGKPIWWNGTDWVDALGNNVSTVYVPAIAGGTVGNVPMIKADGTLEDSNKAAADIP